MQCPYCGDSQTRQDSKTYGGNPCYQCLSCQEIFVLFEQSPNPDESGPVSRPKVVYYYLRLLLSLRHKQRRLMRYLKHCQSLAGQLASACHQLLIQTLGLLLTFCFSSVGFFLTLVSSIKSHLGQFYTQKIVPGLDSLKISTRQLCQHIFIMAETLPQSLWSVLEFHWHLLPVLIMMDLVIRHIIPSMNLFTDVEKLKEVFIERILILGYVEPKPYDWLVYSSAIIIPPLILAITLLVKPLLLSLSIKYFTKIKKVFSSVYSIVFRTQKKGFIPENIASQIAIVVYIIISFLIAIGIQLFLLNLLLLNGHFGSWSEEMVPYGTKFSLAGIGIVVPGAILLYIAGSSDFMVGAFRTATIKPMFRLFGLYLATRFKPKSQESHISRAKQKVLPESKNHNPSQINPLRQLLFNQYLPWAIVVVYTSLRATKIVASSHDYILDGFHIWAASGEFGAVLNGATPLVDFFPTYQRLLSYALLPFFHTFGFSTGSISAAEALLVLISTSFFFVCFCYLTRNRWLALALYIPVCSVSFIPWDLGDIQYRQNMFTYFPVGFLRYPGVMAMVLLCPWYLVRPSRYRLWLLAFVGGLVAINNSDFGLVAFVAAVAAVLLTLPRSELFKLSTLKQVYFPLIAAPITALLGFTFITKLRSGEFPNWTVVIFFQKIFSQYGYGSFPSEVEGLHGVIYMTFIAAVLIGLWRFLRGNINLLHNQQYRLVSGLYIFSGVLGCGILGYYAGRSMPYTLTASFPIWSFTLMIFFWETLQLCFREPKINFSKILLYTLPTVVILFFYINFLGNIITTPPLLAEWARMNRPGDFQDTLMNEAVSFIKSKAMPGENVIIATLDGYQIANLARVRNYMPFLTDSLVTKQQVKQIVATLHQHDIKHIFANLGNGGSGWPFFKEVLDAVSDQYVLSDKMYDNFQYWTKK